MSSAVAPRPSNSWRPIATRVSLATAIIVLALSLSTFAGEHVQRLLNLSTQGRQLLQAVIASGLVIPLIWWLRSRYDGREVGSVGLEYSRRVVGGVAVGVGIVALPVLIIIVASRLFGWASITIDTAPATLQRFALGVITVFLLEAVPEELVVRGYIYRTLSGTLARWKASLLSVLLFVTIPILSTGIQHYLLGLEISLNGSNRIEPSFLIILLIFGSLQQYLRVVSGTIWIGVGFHAAFVLINRIMGPRETQMIRVGEVNGRRPAASPDDRVGGPGPRDDRGLALVGTTVGRLASGRSGITLARSRQTWQWFSRCRRTQRWERVANPSQPPERQRGESEEGQEAHDVGDGRQHDG